VPLQKTRRSNLVALSFFAALAIGPVASAVSFPAFAQQSEAANALERAKVAVSAGDYPAALAAAREAERADPGDYRAKYYLAMSLYGLGQFNAAREASEKAYATAPQSARPRITQLRAKIDAGVDTGGKLTEAEEALREGLHAKAGRLFAEVWAADKTQVDAALKASEIYATRMDDPLIAAGLLVDIKRSAASPADIIRADELLAALTPRVKASVVEQLRLARYESWGSAKERLRRVMRADPENADAYVVAFERAVAANDPDFVEIAVKGLGRLSRLDVTLVISQPSIEQMLVRPAFLQLMRDIKGDGFAATLEAEITPHGRLSIIQQMVTSRRVRFAFDEYEKRYYGLTNYWLYELVGFQFVNKCEYVMSFNQTPLFGNPAPASFTLSLDSVGVAISDYLEVLPTGDFRGYGSFLRFKKLDLVDRTQTFYFSLNGGDQLSLLRFRRALSGMKSDCDGT
jgi:tetratricopeptide (TPR) repeat protein